MFRKFFGGRIANVAALFKDHFVDARVLYVGRFGTVPSISFIGELDITPAFAMIRERYSNEIVSILQHTYYDHTERKMYFNNTVFILKNERMIELADNYCQVLHNPDHSTWAVGLINALADFRVQATPTGPSPVIGFGRQTSMN